MILPYLISFKTLLFNQVWCIPVIPELGEIMQEDCEFEVIWGYPVSPWLEM